jgi:hypothetical protein
MVLPATVSKNAGCMANRVVQWTSRTGQRVPFDLIWENQTMKPSTPLTPFEKRSVLLFASLSLAAAGQAFAQSTAPASDAGAQAQAMLQQADTNGDGRLDRQEAQAIPGLAERFDAVDTNGDGTVSLQELSAALVRPAS